MTTVAIMQPYLLPYIGYFQTMSAVNKYVIYDDVQFTQAPGSTEGTAGGLVTGLPAGRKR